MEFTKYFLDLNDFNPVSALDDSQNCIIVENVKNKQKYVSNTYPIKFPNKEDELKFQNDSICLSQLKYKALNCIVGYSPIDFQKNNYPTFIREMEPFTLAQILANERNGIKHNEFNETTKMTIIYGIAKGLEFLHKNDVIHCNLTPLNILLDSNLHPTLSEFGIFHLFHKYNLNYESNPSYAAPEILIGGSFTKESDLYSFGSILFEILTGEVPFGRYQGDRNELIEKIISDFRPTIPNYIPQALNSLISCCWSQNPHDRPSITEISNSLYNIIQFKLENINKEFFNHYRDFILKLTPEELFEKGQSLKNIDPVLAAHSLKEAADQGNTNAMIEYGKLLQTGTGVSKNIEISIAYLLMAGEKGNTEGYIKLAEYYRGIENDELSCKYYKIASDKGNTNGMVRYALLLEEGKGVNSDFEAAKQLYKKAADLGNVDGMTNYAGICEDNGDIENAAKYYQMAADNGDEESMEIYAQMLEEGRGVKSNAELAKKYRKRRSNSFAGINQPINETVNPTEIPLSARVGTSSGSFIISKSLFSQQDSKKQENFSDSPKFTLAAILSGNDPKQEKIDAANGGDVEAMNYIAENYANGTNGFHRDVNKAIFYLKKAISKKHIDSMYMYGILLSEKKFNQLNIEKAKQMFQLAAEYGDAKSMVKLGLLEKKDNIDRAIRLFKTAASKGDTDGMVEYATSLENGDLFYRNLEEAFKLYKMAADAGNIHGMANYGRCLSNGIGCEEDKVKGAEMMKKAADAGDLNGMTYYGRALMEGDGVNKNEKEAARYFKMFSRLHRSSSNDRLLFMPPNDEEAVKKYKADADAGDSQAMVNYGIMLESGRGVEQNEEEAVKYYQQAAKMNNFGGMVNLGAMLEDGRGISQNLELAAHYYKVAADGGDSNGMNNFGRMLEEGSGVEMSESLAAEYYRKAAETGNSDGMLNYASMLLDGRGVDEDITKAASFFKRAADLGNTYGMVSYGSMLEKGRGVPKNEAEAAKYYQMAANGGEPIGMASYGIMLASGRGVPKDEVAATKYYKMAADLGNTTGLYNYAIMLRDGRGIEEDQKLATKYFKQLADDGEVDGMVYYGMQLEKGRGVEKNDELAAEYYKKAANTGSSRGMTLYGIMVRDGKGVYQSNADALNYFKMAAEKKYPEGMFNYACMLKDGIGCPKNIELAIRYFQAAANMGHTGAMATYGQCLKEGDGVTQDTKTAIQYLKLSSDANNADGMFRYAQLLQDGENVEQDYVEAMNLYKKSASIGNSSSMNAIGVMYENGLGVEKSNEEAVHFYKMASDAGNSDGMVNYGTMLEEGRGVEANEEEALKLYKKAADLGNRDAMLNYAGLIEERGNEEESAKYYKMLADNGDIDGMEIYASMLEEGRGVPINLSEASHYRKMIDEIKNTKSKSPSHHNEGINLSPNSNISPCSTNSSFFVARVSDSNFTINLDDYHVLSTISRCDQYDTFLIQDKHSRIKYCAKVLNYQCETQNEQEEFKKIISTFFKVNHYAINKLLGFSLTDFHHHQLPTIVSDYIQFSSLEKVLFQCRMNINFIDFTYTYKMISIYGISTALETMHQNQIIHGDLRPYNILYDHNYRPKIIDAGLNLLLKKFRHSTNNLNENKYVYYIPPEILRNENTEFSAKSDVYAFGFLLFEILTYKKPFDDFPSTDEIISKILEGKRPEIPISISENYRELISNCWSDDLSIRPSFEQISAMLRTPEYLLNGTDEAAFNEYIKMVSPMAERKSLLPDYMQFSLTHFNKECVRSADNSDGDACLFVGQSLIEGTNGFDNSPEAGLKYLQAGINVKHPGCYLYLGSLYYDGNIPEYFQLNQEKGLKLIKEAVSFGYDLAMLKLGEIYQANEEDLALIYYKMAAGKGNTDAMVKCGEIFESHDNFEEAFNLYQKAADSGNSKGMLFYGSLLEEGKGCQQNEAEAAKFYQKAAEKGEVDAMENLALMYEEGRGVEKDINKSHIYKSMADKANGVSDNYGISNKFTNSSINSSFIIQKLPNNSGSATVPIENENVLSLDYYLVVDDSYEDNTGPSGKLVLIEDKLSGKKLAAKVLNINVEESQISLGIFDKDIEPLFKVRHLTLAPLKGFSYKDFCKNWIPTIVREYSEGEPLSQIIQNNKERLNPTAILKTLNGTATAIHTLHSCNILHCNIRDTNIIINKDDEPIVVDYGLCSLWDQYSPIDDISKSFPIYNMAPELLKSQIVTYTQASDVYAFGSLIYEIFTKQIPFQGVDSDTVRSHILKSEFPTFPENFPSSFKQLILRCWNANPESRPTMGDIAFELRTLELYLIEGIDAHAYEEYKDKLLNANRKSGIPKFLQSPKLTSGLSKFNSPLQFSLPDRIKNADNGDVDSILYVAKKYIEGGEGFEKDPRKAVHYLEMGLNMKDSEIIYYYGTILETGVLGIPENKIRSNELFNLAASLGNSKAQIKIEQNRSLEIQKITMSDEEAVKKYKADADAGDSQAMVNYGIMLESGRGVEQNEEEAVKYYQQAAIMNNFGGMVNLGAMLEDGRGISQNL